MKDDRKDHVVADASREADEAAREAETEFDHARHGRCEIEEADAARHEAEAAQARADALMRAEADKRWVAWTEANRR